MVLRAMYSGVSGLRAEGEALGVVGDNIANVNTVGFKGQRVIFHDVLGHSILAGTASALPGSGVRVGGIQQLFTQGSLANTGVSTDLALNGDGFFVVKGDVSGVSGNFYTRAGQFVINNEGYLTNSSNLQVQGYAANPDGTFAAGVSSLKVPTAALPPNATENMSITANLDSSATTPTAPWDAQDPSNTSNFSSSMTVYDSLGNAHSLDVYFRKTGANTWDYHVLASGDEVTPPAPGTNVEVGAGSLTFNTSGALDTVTATTPVSVDFTGATAGQAITLDFGNPISGGGTGLDGTTQFASPSNVSAQSQDGYSSGDFSGVTVDGQGVVMGLYTNGQKVAVGQLAVAKFRSNEGLGRAGQNLWIETRESGTSAMGTAGSGGRGAVAAGALEGSNVDLAEEFVGLIQHQRSFSANSKTITTADEMLQELINIKR
ncbi:MAG: flagellar hook protein FlgE [Myxococcales bacterium]|nr:flagellar hook protein FlgE [Myxococcales bacterium]MCB9579333.1 flagellar hook protein FlgE [Polyangiaceae bacterium]